MRLDNIDIIQKERVELINKSLNGGLSAKEEARLEMLDKALDDEESVFYDEYMKNAEKLQGIIDEYKSKMKGNE